MTQTMTQVLGTKYSKVLGVKAAKEIKEKATERCCVYRINQQKFIVENMDVDRL